MMESRPETINQMSDTTPEAINYMLETIPELELSQFSFQQPSFGEPKVTKEINFGQ